MDRWEYHHEVFKVHRVQGYGLQWAADSGDGTVDLLRVRLNQFGAQGWELVSFAFEAQENTVPDLGGGFKRTSPTSARAVFKRRLS